VWRNYKDYLILTKKRKALETTDCSDGRKYEKSKWSFVAIKERYKKTVRLVQSL
jgi:hypothetical protein